LLHDVLVAVERALPERVQLIAQGGDAGGVEPVDPAGPRGAVGDQAGVLEHLQVLRYRRPADRQLLGELADGSRSLCQARDDGAPGGVTQGVPAAPGLVSIHER